MSISPIGGLTKKEKLINRNILITLLFSLIVGLGIGFSIGRNADAFKTYSAVSEKNSKAHNGNKMTSDLGMKDSEFDMRFIDGMIEHHEGAIDMANQALKSSDRPEIKNMANDIIKAQSDEITQLKQWREEWYGNR